jgi:putative ABC transport system permease protein
MATLIQDIRYGLRMLLASPTFTAIAVLALALGIGANSAIFSVVNAVLLRPLPYREPDRIVSINKIADKGGLPGIAAHEYLDWQEHNQVFDEVAGYSSDNYNLVYNGEPERISCAKVTASFFTLLGVEPVRGRAFLPEEDRPGHNQVAIISEGFWQRRAGGDPDIVGRAFTLNDKSYTIVGVMPESLRFPSSYDIWLPFALDPVAERTGDFWTLLDVIGRLKPDVSSERAQSDLESIIAWRQQQEKSEPRGVRLNIISLREQIVGQMRLLILVLIGAVGFVLLIACANVANLLLARGAARQKEIAIRVAVGAGRWRIVRQLLTESVMLSVMAGALAVLIALWSVDLMVSALPRDLANSIHSLNDIRVDFQSLGFTFAVSFVTGLIFGLGPALIASKPDLTETLKEGSGKTASASLKSLRGMLVVTELALALMLLAGAGLMIKSFARLLEVKPGYNAENVLTMRVELPMSRYRKPIQRAAFFQQALERVESLPEVRSVGVINHTPLSGYGLIAFFTLESDSQLEREKDPPIPIGVISEDYFKALEIPLVEGRYFDERDGEGSQKVVVINQALARRFWPGESPIGKSLGFGCEDGLCRTIVGVVGDVRQESLVDDLRPEIFLPYRQFPINSMTLMARSDADPAKLTAAIRAQVLSVDPNQPISNVKTLDEHISDSIAQPRLTMVLLGIFAALALVLATVGVYGVMSYSVAQRTREIGIRMALGAGKGDVLRLVIGQAALMLIVGAGIGLAGSVALTRFMESLLFGVSATDPPTFAAITILLAGVALVASYIPARRAMKVDPMVALRHE